MFYLLEINLCKHRRWDANKIEDLIKMAQKKIKNEFKIKKFFKYVVTIPSMNHPRITPDYFFEKRQKNATLYFADCFSVLCLISKRRDFVGLFATTILQQKKIIVAVYGSY